MRFFEINDSYSIHVNNEEITLLEIIEATEGKLFKSELDERQKELARKMVSRGVLERKRHNGTVYFEHNIKNFDIGKDNE